MLNAYEILSCVLTLAAFLGLFGLIAFIQAERRWRSEHGGHD